MIDDFLHHCRQVLAGDTAHIEMLCQHGFACENQQWQFTLPELFHLLSHIIWEDDSRAYKQFRKQLFESDINRQLMLLGAEIAIAKNTGKVDHNLYWLRMKAQPQAP